MTEVLAILVAHRPQEEVLQNLLQDLRRQTLPPRIQVVRTDHPQEGALFTENRGYAQALNFVIRRELARYYLLCNTDLRLDPRAVEILHATAEAHPDAGIVCPKVLQAQNPILLDGVGGGLDPYFQAFNRGHGLPDYGQMDIPETPVSAYFACALLRRAAWEAAGPLEESFFLYYEDVEYALRLRRLGFRIYTAPGARVWHYGSQSVSAVLPEKTYLLRRNLLRTALRHAPLATLLRSLAFHLLLTWEGVRRREAGLWMEIWLGFLAFLGVDLAYRWSAPPASLEGHLVALPRVFPPECKESREEEALRWALAFRTERPFRDYVLAKYRVEHGRRFV